MNDSLSRLSRRILSDQDILARLLALPDEQARAEEAARIGREMGLCVTPETAREYFTRSMAPGLSGQELDRVAGARRARPSSGSMATMS